MINRWRDRNTKLLHMKHYTIKITPSIHVKRYYIEIVYNTKYNLQIGKLYNINYISIAIKLKKYMRFSAVLH